VRQLVHGKRFFLDEFDYEPRDVWIPDVFGYPGCLPQIIREAGSEYFLTQKMSWNDTNRFPHSSFWWEGIDGSRVFTHFPPADTYIGNMSVAELRASERRFAQHAVSQRSLYPFGHGDGGGGATAEMLESARRLADTDGSPRIHHESAIEFFQKATAEAGELPVWSGELYAEFHRGTYTTQGRTKRNNRKCEQLLAATELWCSVAALAGADYPTSELDAAWKLLLLQQFHDVIPGSSIHWVYEDTERDYAELRRLVEPAKAAAQEFVAASVDTAGWTRPVVVFNQVGHDRVELVQLDASTAPAGARSASGELLPVQRLRDGSVLFPAEVPGCGHAAYDLLDALPASEAVPSVPSPVVVSGNTMSNGLVSVTWDEQGHVVSLLDEASGRDAIPAGERGNLFQLFHDYPNSFDAWDIDLTYTERCEDLVDLDQLEVVEAGPLRAAVRIVRSFGGSRIEQVMRLDAGARHVVFDTEVDWQESQRLLKVGFPVAVRAQRATYDIQHGHVERATHTNTSWDQARFEVCAHQWADLAEPGFGLALINDCKYGYDATSNRLRLSLLRSSTAPDPLADKGHHVFSYAVLPHTGDLRDAGVIELGLAFNAPLEAVVTVPSGGAVLASGSHVTVDGAGAVIDAVKKPDDGDGLVIRLHEAYGGHRTVTLSADRPIRTAVRTDLLERAVEELEVREGSVQIELTPFQLRTIRLGFEA
jgi:alpha-mannosidase